MLGSLPSFADEYTHIRNAMVERQIADRGIRDGRVLEAVRKVPRHLFVPPRYERSAYDDTPLPIGEGQTISQPYIVALMTELMGVGEGGRVLEVGTGSGYQAAVLSGLCAEVYTIEIKKGLHERATPLLKRLGYDNVHARFGDGYYGWEEKGPFDAIMITAAANHIPPPLIRQLKEGGRLVLPLGSTSLFQTLTVVTKNGEKLDVRQVLGVRFVPMTGKMLE